MTLFPRKLFEYPWHWRWPTLTLYLDASGIFGRWSKEELFLHQDHIHFDHSFWNLGLSENRNKVRSNIVIACVIFRSCSTESDLIKKKNRMHRNSHIAVKAFFIFMFRNLTLRWSFFKIFSSCFKENYLV